MSPQSKKILVVTYGSRGDVQPFLALALALKEKGYQVIFTGPPENASWINSYNCPFHPLGSNMDILAKQIENAHSLNSGIAFIKFMRQEIDYQFSQLPQIIKGADLVIGAPLTLALLSVAELMKIPYLFMALCPQMIPSSIHPFVYNFNLPSWMSQPLYYMGKIPDKFFMKRLINKKRSSLGLNKLALDETSLMHLLGSKVLMATDSVLGQVGTNPVRESFQTGYLHLKQQGEIDTDLKEFIEVGEPPIYIGFGSMPNKSLETSLNFVLQAARSQGQRVIYSVGSNLDNSCIHSQDCFFANNIPHDYLFPLVKAVIHHGGAGTTATAAKAGVPQIIIPHILDQFYWAICVSKAGLGPKSIYRGLLNAKRLTRAIHEISVRDIYQRNAQKVAATIKAQDSLEMAVQFIKTNFL